MDAAAGIGCGACVAACPNASAALCPKEIRLEAIARMNRDFLRASVMNREGFREDSEQTNQEPRTGGRR